MRRVFLASLIGLLLGAAAVVLTQAPSAGGSFLPLDNVTLGPNARWLWKLATNPICFEGATDDDNETCLTAEDPTGDRNHTLPNSASDTVALIAATQTFTNKTLTAPVLSGSVTGTYTLAGAPSFTRTTVSNTAYTALTTDLVIATTSIEAARNLTLFTAANLTGRILILTREVNNTTTTTVLPSQGSGQTINGATSQVFNTAYGTLRLMSTGTNWVTW